MKERGAKTRLPKSIKRSVKKQKGIAKRSSSTQVESAGNDKTKAPAKTQSDRQSNDQLVLIKRKGATMQTIANWILLLAAIAALLITPLLYYHKQTVACWTTFIAILLFALGGCLQWQNRIWENEVRARPFLIHVGTVLTGTKRDFRVSLWFSYRSKYGVTLSPIHRMMVIRLTNLQKVRSMIETYRVEVQTSRGEWINLTRINGESGTAYMMPVTPKQSLLFDMPTLDRVLATRSISPNETIEGAAFFEFSEDIATTQPMRIYVKDFGGAEMTETLLGGGPAGDFAQSWTVQGRAMVDLSNSTVAYWSDAMR